MRTHCAREIEFYDGVCWDCWYEKWTKESLIERTRNRHQFY